MRTSYFIAGGRGTAPDGLEAALGDEAVRFRRRPGWLPPASVPHPVEGLYAAWEACARWMHRASSVKKGILDSFMIVVVLNPVESLRTVLLAAVRSFGAANTLLVIVDNEMYEEGWYQEVAAIAGSCGSRASLVALR